MCHAHLNAHKRKNRKYERRSRKLSKVEVGILDLDSAPYTQRKFVKGHILKVRDNCLLLELCLAS